MKIIKDYVKRALNNSSDISKLIVVIDNVLYLYDYQTEEILITTKCWFGKNGFSDNRKANDGTTPIGLFKVLYGFGTEQLDLPHLKYKQINQTSYFCDDIDSNNYNSWVETSKTIIGEHLIDYPNEYHYGLVFDFNMNPIVKGKGSSIFLHCKGKKEYTMGCISIDDVIMYKILYLIDSNSYILIIPSKGYLKTL